jgi:hypothetical protein
MPNASYNRSPSMSRAAPYQGNRSAQYSAANRTAGQRPAPATGQRNYAGSANRAAQRPAARPSPGTPQTKSRESVASKANSRPSQSQLNDFLKMPADSSRGKTASSTARPGQLPAGSKGGSKTVTGPRGGQATVGGIGGTRTGPGGTTIGAGRAGVKVTGPGGNTYTKVAGGAAIRGPGGNTVAAGRGASFANGQFVGGRSWAAVNGNFTRWNCFTGGWYRRYLGAWWPGVWFGAGTAWATAPWAVAGDYCGCSGGGVYYDYGENVTYEGDNVYYGDEAVASTEEYYDQADELAASGQEAKDEEWLPLGVFAVISDADQTKTDRTVQLAVNKDGVIRGNLQDALSDNVTPLVGAVDKKTQRIAIKIEGNEAAVAETGLYNLTNDEVPILIHFGPDHRETRTLIRLKPPEDEKEQDE